WVKESDLTQSSPLKHVTVDKDDKTLYFTGEGKAYSKAWGGSKDLVYEDMTDFAGAKFHVNLTEKVGNNTWYRGTLDGKTIWLHESYVAELEESKTSRLGHLRKNSTIYETIGDPSTAMETDEYLNAVYYIKKQAKLNDQTYYLISLEPSSTKGVIGWVKAEDMSTHKHVTVDKDDKTLYFTGEGKAYSKAWGGSKDLVYEDMTDFAGAKFHVNLTEKVGNNTWYRGTLDGKTIWLHESYVSEHEEIPINLTLQEAINIQMKPSPQTDQKQAWVSKAYI